ncbi:MAG: ABC transporter substrate binding protein [Methylovulum sp.]|nr:ABC transporter substrate binding protein [Methylovulum sp.]
MHRYLFLLLPMLCGSFFTLAAAWAETPSIAVLYPEVRDPYRAVFLEIIRGMEKGLGQSVTPYVLENEPSRLTSIIEKMKEDNIDVVVSLGRAGLEVAKKLGETFPVVIGAVMIAPGQDIQGLTGISLVPDPDVLFEQLQRIVPIIKEITVVFDPKQTAWEIEYAKKAAKAHGFSLNALSAQDIQHSSTLYRQVLVEIKDNSIALWLPHDGIAMTEQALLPVVLKEAWEKNFVVFSSNLDHVRKGALFSLYPDNIGMGHSLAALALQQLSAGATKTAGIKPLRDLLLAVNLRTAEHLGLQFSSRARQEFGLVFPNSQ